MPAIHSPLELPCRTRDLSSAALVVAPAVPRSQGLVALWRVLLPGSTLTTKGQANPYPIESLQLVRFDGKNYQPVGAVMSFEGKTPKH